MSNFNFYCPKTGKKFLIGTHRTTFSEGKMVYKDNYGRILINEENGEHLLPIEKEIDWSKGVPMTILGNDKASIEKRSEQLKQRSSDHYKREISEKRYQMNKDYVNKFKEQ